MSKQVLIKATINNSPEEGKYRACPQSIWDSPNWDSDEHIFTIPKEDVVNESQDQAAYLQGCLHAWDVMWQLAGQPLEILKRIAPTGAVKVSYPALFSSITYEDGQEMARKLLPQDGDEVKITYPETNKTKLGYVAYVLNPSCIKVFIPDTLEFVTWSFPNTNVVKTGINKRDEIMALWLAIDAFGGETDDGSGITGV